VESRTIFFVVLIAAVVVGGGAALFVRSQKKQVAPVAQLEPTLAPVVELATWKDQSEYSFQYPKDLTLNPHDDDQENYSHVELTSGVHPGSIILWVKDTTAKDIAAFMKQQKITTAIDSTLGNTPAKKVLENEGKKLTITTLREGYLYQIEANLNDADYWNKILDTIVTSYSFTGSLPADSFGQSSQNAPPGDSGSTDVEFEGEEVIE